MNINTLVVSSIAGLTILISTFLLSEAIKEFGKSMERMAQYQRVIDIPDQITLKIEGGRNPLRFDSKAAE